MKKLIALLLALALMVTVTGCGEHKTTTTPTDGSADDTPLDPNEKVTLIVECEVDPQIQEKGSSIYLSYWNKTSEEEFDMTIHKTASYRTRMEIPQGEYICMTAMVVGDLEGKYPVEFKNFTAKGLTVELKVKAEVYNASDEDISDESPDLPGTIDEDKTGELLEEDGFM